MKRSLALGSPAKDGAKKSAAMPSATANNDTSVRYLISEASKRALIVGKHGPKSMTGISSTTLRYFRGRLCKRSTRSIA